MEVNVTVERLWMDNKMYRRGDLLDISEERVAQIITSVERVVPTVVQIDERDAEIGILKAKVEELEIALAANVPENGVTIGKKAPVKNRGSR